MVDADRLRWRCRRGMRELDLVLSQFLDREYPQLIEADRAQFRALLEQPDPDLYAWILGTASPGDESFVGVIERLRALSLEPGSVTGRPP